MGHKIFFRPPTLLVTPWVMGACANWQIFDEKNLLTPLVYVQTDQCVMGIILRYVCWGTH